jgi:signal transduction histidine kinase
MAWVEYFKIKPPFKDEPAILEIEKDIERLEIVTKRFSNIGSIPIMKEEDFLEVVEAIVQYLQKRISSKIVLEIESQLRVGTRAHLNRPLFQWVLENVIKNAVDSIQDEGKISIQLSGPENNQLIMDISDSGKGIPKSRIKDVFQPGFTSKKRGWGLGLTLAKRIVEEYHQGKIFVKQSDPQRGTTFRIFLKSYDGKSFAVFFSSAFLA